MKLPPIVKQFLNKPEIQELLNQYKFKEIYAILIEESSHFVKAEVPEFTKLCLVSGINPLNYMDEVPKAFAFNSEIEEITIPNTIRKINAYAFQRCTHLNHIYYQGTREQWKKIDMPMGVFAFTPTASIECTDGEIIL